MLTSLPSPSLTSICFEESGGRNGEFGAANKKGGGWCHPPFLLSLSPYWGLNKSCGTPAVEKIKSREASSC
jgi:hypothetical protein